MNIQRGTIRYRYSRRDFTAVFRVGDLHRSTGIEIDARLTELEQGWRITITLIPSGPIEVYELFLEGNYRFTPETRIFCNGFQTWTETREFFMNERIPKLSPLGRPFKLQRFSDYHFYPYNGKKGSLHSHTYCYMTQQTDDMTVLGSLTEENGYTIFSLETKKNRITIRKDVEGLAIAGPYCVLDLLQLQGPQDAVLPAYFETLCPGLEVKQPVTGWTSWYNYYTKISEEVILENIDALVTCNAPIDIFQIDDGWQEAVGDWLAVKSTFPRGMGFIASAAREAGFTPGIWLAPFICVEGSRMMKEHPEWLLRKNGKPVPAGWNPLWGGNFYALDTSNDEFRYHLREVFDTVLDEWGYHLVKLDFLYAAGMEPNGGRTRGALMVDAMKFLRRCVGNRLILGCGVPLGTAFGLVDYCRIGSDVGPKWEDRLLSAIHYRERVSTLNSLTSTVGRNHLNSRVFVNDPDVAILRDEGVSLSQRQRHTLFMLNNALGGVLFISDNISRYEPDTLSLYLSAFPFKEKEDVKVLKNGSLIEISFRIRDNRYYLFSNLGGNRARARLDEGYYFSNQPGEGPMFVTGGEIVLSPYETRCYLVVKEEFFTVAGSTAHIFPGSEIVSCVQKGDTIAITQDERVRNRNTVYIRTPGLGQYFFNGIPASAEKVRDKLFIMKLELS